MNLFSLSLQRFGLWTLIVLVLLGLGVGVGQPDAQAQSIPALHLTLGNPSNAVTDVNMPTNYLMEKPQYALAYHRDDGHANWVSWHLGFQDLGSAPRSDAWSPDSTLPAAWYHVVHSDYTGSGYDRGHMTPSADRTATDADNEATFLMTNIIPQAPDNNQGPWAALETYARTQVGAGNELYIISGGAGTLGMIPSGRVKIPARTWKVLLVLPEGQNDLARISTTTRVIAVDMPNTQGIRNIPWQSYRTSVDAIEALTGYDFLSNVDPAIQSVIEAQIDGGATPTPTFVPTNTPSGTPTFTPTWTATPVLCPTVVSGQITPQCTPTPTRPATNTPDFSYLPFIEKNLPPGTCPTHVNTNSAPQCTPTSTHTPTQVICPTFMGNSSTPQCTAVPTWWTTTPIPPTPTLTSTPPSTPTPGTPSPSGTPGGALLPSNK